MWRRPRSSPADVDVAELYDGFTFLTLAWLEALGFCADGEAGPFVEGGRASRSTASCRLNTYGGQLSAGPDARLLGAARGLSAAARRAGPTALPKRPEVAVVSAGGGPIAGCVLLSC